MKIAWFTPFSRMSAIGQFSSIVVQTLAKYAEITVYVSDTENAQDTWLPKFNQRSIKSIPWRDLQIALRNYDMLIYNMGDYHPWHSDILMIHAVIDAIGQSAILSDRVVFDVIGRSTETYQDELNRQIARYNLSSVVNLLGYMPDDVLHRYIADADLIVNLRNPHFGESSWVLLEAAFSAKPTVVWKHGYYDEYPDHTVAKVTDESRRNALGRDILRYAQQTFNTERYCRELLSLIEEARYNKPLLQLIDFMSAKIAEIQPGDSTLAQRTAAEISSLT